MTSKCQKCNMPVAPTAARCPFCNSARGPVTVTSGPSAFPGITASSRSQLNRRDLVLSWIYEVVLMVMTLGLGGLVWSAILARDGQTPGTKVRDELLVNIRNGNKAPIWKLLIRQVLLFASLVYIVLGLVFGFGLVLDIGGYWFATLFLPVGLLSLMVLDFLLIFTPVKRRLIDWVLAMKIVEGNGYSFRAFQTNTGGF